MPPGLHRGFRVGTRRRTFASVFAGTAAFADASAPGGVLLEKEIGGAEVNVRDLSGNRTLMRFGTAEEIAVQAGEEGVPFLLVSGAPIREPVAWHGPIVPNTREERRQAVADLRDATLIRPRH